MTLVLAAAARSTSRAASRLKRILGELRDPYLAARPTGDRWAFPHHHSACGAPAGRRCNRSRVGRVRARQRCGRHAIRFPSIGSNRWNVRDGDGLNGEFSRVGANERQHLGAVEDENAVREELVARVCRQWAERLVNLRSGCHLPIHFRLFPVFRSFAERARIRSAARFRPSDPSFASRLALAEAGGCRQSCFATDWCCSRQSPHLTLHTSVQDWDRCLSLKLTTVSHPST
jgi:hypothetical protein